MAYSASFHCILLKLGALARKEGPSGTADLGRQCMAAAAVNIVMTLQIE